MVKRFTNLKLDENILKIEENSRKNENKPEGAWSQSTGDIICSDRANDVTSMTRPICSICKAIR